MAANTSTDANAFPPRPSPDTDPLSRRTVPGVEVVVTARDGHALAGRIFTPQAPVCGAVLIAPAMGVAQRFYEPFAQWLAGLGFGVLTFDYRGMGASRRGGLRGFETDILTWAEQDCGAALDHLAERFAGVSITWLGHSLGGQVIPFVPGIERVAKIITVGTGSGYWRENAAPLRRKVGLLWWGFVPVTVPLFGYFPGKRLGMVGDLPRGVIRQWRRWCLDPDYVVGAEPGARERFAAVTTPITSFSFEDDEMMSLRNTESIHGFYTGAARVMRRFAPADLGVERVGHFGFFRAAMEAPLWEGQVRGELAGA